jgi:hypothetical protein
MNKINYIVLVGRPLAGPLGAGLATQIAKQGRSGQGVGARQRRGVLGKQVREVVGVNMHCFEVTGGEGLTAVATPR